MDHRQIADRRGTMAYSIGRTRANDNCEMKILGAKKFERSYTLVGGAGPHQPGTISSLMFKLLAVKNATS
jgi:hypothetical protein